VREIARTKNVTRLQQAYQQVKNRASDEHGLILVYGPPGYGKTTAVGELFVRENGVLVTCYPGWTQKALLETLLAEFRREAKGSNADKMKVLIDVVADQGRPIFVDEAGFAIGDSRMVETLRLIHDVSGQPVVLVGMSDFNKSRENIDIKIRKFPQYADRISQWVPFAPADLADLKIVAKAVCPVAIADDLAQRLLDRSKGNIRRIRAGLSEVTREAKANQLASMSLSQWGEKRKFMFEEGWNG